MPVRYARWRADNGDAATIPYHPQNPAAEMRDARGRTWVRVAVTAEPHACQADAALALDKQERRDAAPPHN